jgi:hypothetical protein
MTGNSKLNPLMYFFFLVVLGFELRASHASEQTKTVTTGLTNPIDKKTRVKTKE